MNEKLNFHIAQLQMLALSLSTNPDHEIRRQTLIRIRDETYQAQAELILHVMPRPLRPRPPMAAVRPKFGVNDL